MAVQTTGYKEENRFFYKEVFKLLIILKSYSNDEFI